MPEPIAKIVEMILLQIHKLSDNSQDGFVEICANDFGLSHDRFVEQLGIIIQRPYKFVVQQKSQNPTELDIDNILESSLMRIIKDEKSKISIALTYKGRSEIERIQRRNR